MSLKKWVKKFYPIPVNETTKKEAISHTIRKWQGLSHRNRDKYDVSIIEEADGVPGLIDNNNTCDLFPLDVTTCALCYHYYDECPACGNCPLYLIRNNNECWQPMEGEDKSPYDEIQQKPGSMLSWLNKCLEKNKDV